MLSGEAATLHLMAEPAAARPPNGALRVALEGTISGKPWVNRFWCQTTMSGTPTAAQVLALSNAISAAWRTRFLANLTDEVVANKQRTVLFVSSTSEVAVDGADTGTGPGTVQCAPPQVCILINWSIAGSYRGGHPRTYIPGPPIDNINENGTIVTADRTQFSTAAANFLSDVNALAPGGFTAVQLGTFRFFRHHLAVDPPVFEPFLGGTCNTLVATQRRRLGR